MFLIKLHRNKFHFDKRQFSNLVQCEGGGGGEGRIKTVVDKRNRITRKTERGEWESVIGLEVHAQINANTKIFRWGTVRVSLCKVWKVCIAFN